MDTNLQNILNAYTSKLKPIEAFSNVLPYDTFAKPLTEYSKQVAESYKPWYEYFTASPQKQQLSNQAAAGGANMTGFGGNIIQKQLRNIYQPLDEQLYGQGGVLENYLSNYVTPLYNQRISNYYQSPITGFNY
jgi:hypothetical protein